MGVTAVNNPTLAALLGPTALVVLTVLGTMAQLTSGSFQQVHGWVSPDELNGAGPEHAWKGTNDPLTSTDRGYLYMLQHDVGEVVELATTHGPLYVFIDDLDRCGPAIVADTIEAINLFLNKAFGQCVFVVALDPATVAAHLETTFGAIDDRVRSDAASFGHLQHIGWRFMEKIIDLPIRLPRVTDAALKQYLDELLLSAAAGPVGPPTPGPQPRPEPQQHAPVTQPSGGPATTTDDLPDPGAAVQSIIVPGGTGVRSTRVVQELENIDVVRAALHVAALNLPNRNPRQTKTFINLWRFYMVLEHRSGLFSPSRPTLERHSIAMARLVELMLRWPYLLDLLGEPVAETPGAGYSHLEVLLDHCDDDESWSAICADLGLVEGDRAVRALRELFKRVLSEREQFTTIAKRYL